MAALTLTMVQSGTTSGANAAFRRAITRFRKDLSAHAIGVASTAVA